MRYSSPRWPVHRWFCFRATIWLAVAVGPAFLRAETSEVPLFERDVRPILKAYCLECHGGQAELEGGLDLRLQRFMLRGGMSGPAIVAADPDASLLVQRVRAGEMPPGEKKLPAHELSVLEKWIRAGAPTKGPEPDSLEPGIQITAEERAYWAFQPLVRPPLPLTGATPTLSTAVDAFVVARLSQKQLELSPLADRPTLARRLYFDLLGLPPSLEVVQQFAADERPDAYDRLLDYLLASPRYGERWARHWLDVAGYADSSGANTVDAERPYAYKYRDYVVRAINADKPWNQFLTEQLAGDELVPAPHTNLAPDAIDRLTATGFLRMAADGTGGGGDQELGRNQVVADTLKIVSSSLLGLTVACAQCHDHRYDPIPQADYYRLRAVFEPALDWKQWRNPSERLISLYTDGDRAKAAEVEAEAQQIAQERNAKQATYMAAALEKELMKFDEPKREQLRAALQAAADKRTPEQIKLLAENPSVNISPGVLYQYDQAAADDLKKYDERIAQTRAKKPVEDFLHVLVEPANSQPATFVFHRGDHRQPKAPVTPGDLTIAAAAGHRFEIPADDPQLPTSGRRLAFARWLTQGQHPLLGRVLVNRIWLNHFGRGIVGTPGDFGILGERPSHPELLDWLATEWQRDDWSLKRLHRVVLNSTTFRQSSRRSASGNAGDSVDSGNQLLWHSPVRRLDAEILRDRVLATSGQLSTQMFGPAVPVKEDDVGQIVVGGDETRRSVYLQVRRSKPIALLATFDAPVMETNCERRSPSTSASQSLFLMNSAFVLQQASSFAERVRREASSSVSLPLAPERDAQLAVAARRWRYGSGVIDEAAQRVSSFQFLPHWTGSTWQGSPELPAPATGWVLLHAAGGHPGRPLAAIRRWSATRSAIVNVQGKLQHGSENGDGIRGRVVSSRTGVVGDWTVQHGETSTPVNALQVEAGDTLDFVVDCREHETSDSFGWSLELRERPVDQPRDFLWKSERDFGGPSQGDWVPWISKAWQLAYARDVSPEELNRAVSFVSEQLEELRLVREQAPAAELELLVLNSLCQALLASSEFLYVD